MKSEPRVQGHQYGRSAVRRRIGCVGLAYLGGRFEARDFYSGTPALNVDTGRSRQHNYYVGVGVIHRF